MALQIPTTAAEVDRKAKNDVKNELQQSNPFLRDSWLGAIVTSIANRVFDLYYSLQRVAEESIPDTAIDQLERWAGIFGIERDEGTSAVGGVVFTGSLAAIIPVGTVVASSDGIEYELNADATIGNSTISVTSIVRVDTTATVTCAGPHGFSSAVKPVIAGADQDEYNGVQTIIVESDTTFTFEVEGTPVTPATGTITASGTKGNVDVTSVEAGEDKNQAFGTGLTLLTPIIGVDDECLVDTEGITGGGDLQSDEDLRAELLERIANPVAHFNVADIVTKAKTVAGVTRVFVEESYPLDGQVTVNFMRDNDDNPIPSAAQSTTVKNELVKILPANTAQSDLIVSGPTGVTQNFTFSALSPNSLSMQDAVRASLERFFAEDTEIGEDVVEVAYSAAIYNTLDPATGLSVTSFTLTDPSGDISISTGEMAVLGSVSFPAP